MRKGRKFWSAFALSGLGLAAACSSSVPSVSQGALSIYLTNVDNSMAGVSCPPMAHWVNIPFSAAGGQQTTAVNKGNEAVDGVNEMGVTCMVKDNGGGAFDVNATLKSPALDAQGNRVPIGTLVSFATTIAPGQTGAQGQLSLQDNKTGSGYSSNACIFSVQPVQQSDQLSVAPGRMWARVTCPKFSDPLSPDMGAVCQINPGYVVLENCSQ